LLFLVLIAFVWIAVTNIQMATRLKAIKRMEMLRLALEADREATLAATGLGKYVAKYSEAAIQKAGENGVEASRNWFENWSERLF
tara:strand:- start:258 stop:512 length:255 start_codon:yes stop_codon:yes gene_type:complete